MIALEVQVASQVAVAAMDALTRPAKRDTKEAIGVLIINQARTNIAGRSGPAGAWPSGPWTTLYGGARTWNDISRSLRAEATGDGVSVGANHIAAGVRHFGTVGAGGTLPDIVPVKKKALTIPISEAASKASYRGLPAREAFPDAFLLTKDGKHGASPTFLGVIARKVGGRTNKKTGEKTGQKLELLYLLVARVAIRPHPFMPIDKAGKLSPPSLGTDIDKLIIDSYVAQNATGGA